MNNMFQRIYFADVLPLCLELKTGVNAVYQNNKHKFKK